MRFLRARLLPVRIRLIEAQDHVLECDSRGELFEEAVGSDVARPAFRCCRGGRQAAGAEARPRRGAAARPTRCPRRLPVAPGSVPRPPLALRQRVAATLPAALAPRSRARSPSHAENRRRPVCIGRRFRCDVVERAAFMGGGGSQALDGRVAVHLAVEYGVKHVYLLPTGTTFDPGVAPRRDRRIRQRTSAAWIQSAVYSA